MYHNLPTVILTGCNTVSQRYTPSAVFSYVCFVSVCSVGFKFLFNFLLILCEFYIIHPNPTHFLVPLYLPFYLATSPTKEKEILWKLQCVTMCTPFCPHSFTCKCSLQELLVWFEASGFCYPINTGSLPGLLSDTLSLPCIVHL